MSTKDSRIAFRASEELKGRLAAVSKTVRMTETNLAEACVEALVEYIERNGEITLPLAIVPKSELGGKEQDLARSTPPLRRALYAEDIAVPSPSSIATSRLNEDTPDLNPPATGPRARSTRPGVKKTIEREKGKTP